MASIQQIKELKDKIQVLREKTFNNDFDELIKTKREELGDQKSFAEAKEALNQFQELIKILLNYQLEELPFDILNKINNVAANYENLIKEIDDFKENPEERVDQYQARYQALVDKVVTQHDAALTATIPSIAFLRSKEIDISSIEANLKSQVNEVLANLRKNQEESQQILSNLQQTAGNAGVTKEATLFATEAIENDKTSTKWLISTIIVGSVLLAFALTVFLGYTTPTVTTIQQADGSIEIINPTTIEVIRSFLANGFFFSILYYALVFTSRNYRANRHNFVVNKHRQNALSTFKTFVDSTNDETIKNAVLMKATETIFSPSETGFLNKSSQSTPMAPINIVELAGQSIKE